MKHPPRGKIKPFCVECGAIDQLVWVELGIQRAVKCDPCGKFYGNYSLLWEAMKEHPFFETHIAKDKAKLEAAEAKREMRAEKLAVRWGASGIVPRKGGSDAP